MVARSISAADRVDGAGFPIKAPPYDQQPIPLETPPTYPYVVPTTIREAFYYTGTAYELTEHNDSFTVQLSNIVTSRNSEHQWLPLAFHLQVEGAAYQTLRIFSINPTDPEGFNVAEILPFVWPPVYDSDNREMVGSGIHIDFPASFYSSVASDVWNFKFLWYDNSSFITEIWKTGDEANKTVTHQNFGYVPAPLIRILVGNPEGMYNPFASNLIHPSSATVVSVSRNLGQDSAITGIVFGRIESLTGGEPSDEPTVHENGQPIQWAFDSDWVYEDPVLGSDGYFQAIGGGGSYTWSLVAGTGDTHNAEFEVTPTPSVLSYLRHNGAYVPGSYSIRLRVEDTYGHFFEKAYTVTAP